MTTCDAEVSRKKIALSIIILALVLTPAKLGINISENFYLYLNKHEPRKISKKDAEGSWKAWWPAALAFILHTAFIVLGILIAQNFGEIYKVSFQDTDECEDGYTEVARILVILLIVAYGFWLLNELYCMYNRCLKNELKSNCSQQGIMSTLMAGILLSAFIWLFVYTQEIKPDDATATPVASSIKPVLNKARNVGTTSTTSKPETPVMKRQDPTVRRVPPTMLRDRKPAMRTAQNSVKKVETPKQHVLPEQPADPEQPVKTVEDSMLAAVDDTDIASY